MRPRDRRCIAIGIIRFGVDKLISRFSGTAPPRLQPRWQLKSQQYFFPWSSLGAPFSEFVASLVAAATDSCVPWVRMNSASLRELRRCLEFGGFDLRTG